MMVQQATFLTDMLRRIKNILLCSIVLLSCNDSKKAKDLTIEREKKHRLSDEIKSKQDFIKQDEFLVNYKALSHNDQLLLEKKIESKKQLTDKDYGNLSFIINNLNSEADSENLGYLLFEYFEKNDSDNSKYLSLLNKLNSSDRDKIFSATVKMMCIDFQDNNYSLEKLQKNFVMFNGNSKAIKSFQECMENKVD